MRKILKARNVKLSFLYPFLTISIGHRVVICRGMLWNDSNIRILSMDDLDDDSPESLIEEAIDHEVHDGVENQE